MLAENLGGQNTLTSEEGNIGKTQGYLGGSAHAGLWNFFDIKDSNSTRICVSKLGIFRVFGGSVLQIFISFPGQDVN